MRRILAALALLGCGVEQGCPGEPEPVASDTFYTFCIDNGCALPDISFSSLGCTQATELSTREDCSFAASYRCANGLSLAIVYDGPRMNFTIRGAECATSYIVSSDLEVACE